MAAVAAGKLDPLKVWPEYFADPNSFVPSTESDLSEFTWEPPTPGSYDQDLRAIMAASESVSMKESPEDAMPLPQAPATAPEFEWS